MQVLQPVPGRMSQLLIGVLVAAALSTFTMHMHVAAAHWVGAESLA
jgi:hypothetical protein